MFAFKYACAVGVLTTPGVSGRRMAKNQGLSADRVGTEDREAWFGFGWSAPETDAEVIEPEEIEAEEIEAEEMEPEEMEPETEALETAPVPQRPVRASSRPPARRPPARPRLPRVAADNQNPVATPVVELNMFKAMHGSHAGNVLENINMGDLQGMIQYIHQEIITDHIISEASTRTSRENGVDSLVKYRVLVKNPESMHGVHQDFDGFVTFESGQATNDNQWDIFEENGDFIGIQTQDGRYVKFNDPYYYFSLSGQCPNLPNTEQTISQLCPQTLNRVGFGDCASKAQALEGECLVDHDQRPLRNCICKGGAPIRGGLCGYGGSGPAPALQVPTGQPGCTYSYEPTPVVVRLDDVVGITNVDCGGRSCRDWYDFRQHCADDQFRRTFTSLGRARRVQYCVEYDLHPTCVQMGCDHPMCQRIPEDQRELGLPFWKGRCNQYANQRRAEAFAVAFGVDGAATSHITSLPVSEEHASAPCNRPQVSLECSPNAVAGEGYCTREWSGVCTTCRVPGAEQQTANLDVPICPWSVSRSAEYVAQLGTAGWCANTNPSGVCCLYSDSCTTKIDEVKSQVGTMPLDDNTFGLVIAAMDTEVVDTFLRRVAVEELGVDAAELDGRASEIAEKAYWSWGKAPLKQWLDESGDSHFSMDLLKLDLWTTLFPSVARPTTTAPTTTTTTTTRRRWHFITTARTTAAPVNVGAMPAACACSDTIVASRPGCKAHLGQHFGDFCYIQGGTECAGYGRVRYSRSKRAHYRMCEP